MALARNKFNPDTPKVALRDFTFLDHSLKAGDIFSVEDTGASLRQLRSLYNARYIIDATGDTPEPKQKGTRTAPKAKATPKAKSTPKAKPKAEAITETKLPEEEQKPEPDVNKPEEPSDTVKPEQNTGTAPIKKSWEQ